MPLSIVTLNLQGAFQLRRRCGGNSEQFPSDFLAGRGVPKLFYERRDRMVADLPQLLERAFANTHTINQAVVAMILVFNNFDITQSRFEFVRLKVQEIPLKPSDRRLAPISMSALFAILSLCR